MKSRFLLTALFVLGLPANALACGAYPVGTNANDLVLGMVANGSNIVSYTSITNAGSSRQGMLVYNRTNNTLHLCNGGSWITLSAAAGISAAGSAGQVQFNTAGVLGADSGLFWDNTNKRLGIGTASPADSLHIRNGSSAATLQIDRPAANFGYVNFTTAGSRRWHLGIANGSETGSNAGSDFYINRATDAGVFIDSPFWISRASGNVGIGTTNPDRKLIVSGSGSATSIGLYRTDGANLAFDAPSAATGSLAQIDVSGANSLRFNTNGSERMRIDASGNVGIGTTLPRQPLHVQGNGSNTGLMIGGAGSVAFTLFNTTGAQDALRIRSQNYDGTNANERLTILGNGNVGIGSPAPGNKFEVATGSGGVFAVTDDVGGYVRLRFWGAAANNVVFNRGGSAAGTMWWGEGSDTGAYVFRGSGNFEVGGNAFKPGGGSWAASSDKRLKDIDGSYELGLGAIVRLNIVRFHYKKDNPRNEPSDRQFVGLIAQDVKKIIPEAVSERGDGYLDLDTTPINFALINAVKELKAANDQLRTEFEAYKAANP